MESVSSSAWLLQVVVTRVRLVLTLYMWCYSLIRCRWAPLDDIVMGGVSDSTIELVPGKGEGTTGSRIAAVFTGKVSTG